MTDSKARSHPALRPPRTILVADGDGFQRYLAGRVLEELGFRVLAASDGAEALDLYRRHAEQIDLLLLDGQMAYADGEPVLHEMLFFRPLARVILSSSQGRRPRAEPKGGIGGVAQLPKPYSPSMLAETVLRLLGGHARPTAVARTAALPL